MYKLLIALCLLFSVNASAQLTKNSNPTRFTGKLGLPARASSYFNIKDSGVIYWNTSTGSLYGFYGGVHAPIGGVYTFNTRGGAITPLSSDYSSFYPLLSGSYANPSWISSLAWSKLTSTPTTLAGYGITNAQISGNYITAITGDLTAAGPGSVTSTLATVNSTTGTFGSSTRIPVITVDAKGRTTSVTTVATVGAGVFVPYSNATGSLDMGNYSMKALGIEVSRGRNNVNGNVLYGTGLASTNLSGSSNISIGLDNYWNLTIGNNNVAVGQGINYSIYNSGYRNVHIGNQASNDGQGNTENVAVGYAAGQNNGNGNEFKFNTFLGAYTSTPGNYAHIQNSTALGYGALVNQSNQIVLGNSSVTDVVTTAKVQANGFSATGANPIAGNIVATTLTSNGPSTINSSLGVTGALTGTTATFSSTVTANSFVKSGGTSSQFLMADGSTSLGSGGSLSGTTDYVPKFTSSTAVGNSSIFDNGNVSLRTTATTYAVNMALGANAGIGFFQDGTQSTIIGTNQTIATTNQLSVRGANLDLVGVGTTYARVLTNLNERMRVTPTGQVNIGGNYTNATNTFHVTGNASIGTTITAPTNGLLVTGNVGIGKLAISAGVKAHINGGALVVSDTANNGLSQIRVAVGTRGFGQPFIGTDLFSNALYMGNRENNDVFLISNDIERLRIMSGGRIAIGTTLPTDNGVDQVQINGSTLSTQYKLSALNTAPASATATGTLGEIRIDANFIYICTATNTWKRVAIATW